MSFRTATRHTPRRRPVRAYRCVPAHRPDPPAPPPARAANDQAGDHAYDRDDVTHPQGTGRPWRGARYGAVTHLGELVRLEDPDDYP